STSASDLHNILPNGPPSPLPSLSQHSLRPSSRDHIDFSGIVGLGGPRSLGVHCIDNLCKCWLCNPPDSACWSPRPVNSFCASLCIGCRHFLRCRIAGSCFLTHAGRGSPSV